MPESHVTVLVVEDDESVLDARTVGLAGEGFEVALSETVSTRGTRSTPAARTSSARPGANWSADGNWLFVNVQDPGVTYGITCPWEDGAL